MRRLCLIAFARAEVTGKCVGLLVTFKLMGACSNCRGKQKMSYAIGQYLGPSCICLPPHACMGVCAATVPVCTQASGINYSDLKSMRSEGGRGTQDHSSALTGGVRQAVSSSWSVSMMAKRPRARMLWGIPGLANPFLAKLAAICLRERIGSLDLTNCDVVQCTGAFGASV